MSTKTKFREYTNLTGLRLFGRSGGSSNRRGEIHGRMFDRKNLEFFRFALGLVGPTCLTGIESFSRAAMPQFVQAVLGVCRQFNIRVIAEGVETENELKFLHDAGIRLFQGYLFAKPEFESFPTVARV